MKARPKDARRAPAGPAEAATGRARAKPPKPPLIRLQQVAGNRAVTGLLAGRGHGAGAPQRQSAGAPQRQSAGALQRVPVTAPTTEETLFNQRGTAGQAGPAVYGDTSGAKFDMSRGGSPEVVTVTVRIRFFDQGRTLTGPAGNQSATDTGAKTVIPPADPRRAFAQNMCNTSPPHWNNRAVLVGKRNAPTGVSSWFSDDKGGPVRLPLVFKAVPVWDLTSPADTEIRVFGQATQAGGPTHPIDAGHFYMNKGPNYTGNDEAIYAHEYGHLIGLNDEYSQSNPQMHALLHQIDPGTATARGQAMDREAVRKMVVAALTRPLHDRLRAAGREISQTFSAGRAPVTGALGTSLRTALNDPGVVNLFVANLPPSHARLTKSLPGMVKAATRHPAHSTAIADSVVRKEFAAGALGALVNQLYFTALAGAQGAVNVGGINIKIDVEGDAGLDSSGNVLGGPSGLWNATATGPMAANATSTVNQVVGPLKTGKVPPVRPSGSILRQLTSLPGGWAAFTRAAPAALASATLQTDLATSLTSAWIAKLMAMGPAPAPISRSNTMQAAVNTTVRNSATAAATNAVRAFLTAEIDPVLKSSVTSLMTAVGDEVTRIMGTPADKLALTSPRDPDIAAVATNMQATLQAQATAAKAAQTAATATPGSGATPVNPRTTAPAQSVTYNTVGMMSDNTDVFRQDQFTHLAKLFNDNDKLRHEREDPFTVEMV